MIPDGTASRPLPMWRFGAVFAAVSLIGYGLLIVPVTAAWVDRFTRVLTSAAVVLIVTFGGNAVAIGDLIQSPSTGFNIRVANGCNGIHVSILLWAAVLAFPAVWPKKAIGLLVGTLAIHVLNLARIISLFYLAQYKQSWFEFAHNYLWESLLMLDALGVFWFWARRVMGAPSATNAAR